MKSAKAKFIILICFAFTALATILFYEGYIIQYAWAWFIVPFTDFKPLSYAAAMGISMFLSFLYFAITAGKQLNTIPEEFKYDPIATVIVKFVAIIVSYSAMFGIMALIHLGV